MSHIFKQSLKSSIFSYAGVLIGFITTGLLMPNFLTSEQIGNIALIQSYGQILAVLFLVGIPTSILKIAPFFEDGSNTKNGLFLMVIVTGTVASILILVTSPATNYILSNNVSEYFYTNLLPFTYIFAIGNIFFMLLDNYSNSYGNIATVAMGKDFIQRIAVLLSLILYFYFQFSYTTFAFWFVLCNLLPALVILIDTIHRKNASLKLDTKVFNRKFFSVVKSYSFFGFANSLSLVLVLSLDTIMIEIYDSTSFAGIYKTVFYFTSILLIPSKAITKSTGYIVARAFHVNDIKKVEALYKKTALTQAIIGVIFVSGLLFCTPIIFSILKPEYKAGHPVLILIALANFYNMAAGNNFLVMNYSSIYRMRLYLSFLFLFFMIGLNWLLIPRYGITGAAIASLISTVIYQSSSCTILWIKENLSLTSPEYVKVITFGIIILTISILVSLNIENTLLALTIGIICNGLFIAWVIKNKLLPDINELIENKISRA